MKKFLRFVFFGKYADEREMQELLVIGNISFWILFFALFVTSVVQLTALRMPPQSLFGELICLFVGIFSLMIGYLTRGVGGTGFKNKKNAPFKTSLLAAFIAMIIGGVIFVIATYGSWNELNMKYILIEPICAFVLTFVLCYTFFTVLKRRRKKLERKYQEDAQDKQAESKTITQRRTKC